MNLFVEEMYMSIMKIISMATLCLFMSRVSDAKRKSEYEAIIARNARINKEAMDNE